MRTIFRQAPRTTHNLEKTWVRTLGLGLTTGLRSMMGPALLSRAAAHGDLEGVRNTPFAALASLKVSRVLTLFAAGEALADKTPVVPSRSSAPGLIQRAAFGATVGAALYTARKLDGKVGAFFGAVAAVAGALAGESIRRKAGERTGAPAPLFALLEDAVAISLGLLSLRCGASR